MNEHETIAAIIAEMRDLAEHRDWHNHTGQSNRERVTDLADRLEAALKREVDELNSAIQATVGRSDAEIDQLRREIAELKQAGNAAKLREATKYVQSTMERLRDPTDKNNAEFIRIWEIVSAALAAPPRNCDRFASAEEALDAYDEWVESYRANGEVPPFNEFGWLFAPATEKEGGDRWQVR